MILVDKEISLSDTSGLKIPDIEISAFRLYHFRFYGIGLKDVSPKIYTQDEKKFFMYGNAHLVGTYIDIYFFAFQDMSPLIAIIGVLSGVCAVLGITLLVLKKVQDLSIIFYGIISITFLVYFRKPLKHLLKL